VTFYVKRPGQHEGVPVSPTDDSGWESLDASLDEWCLYLPHQCNAWEVGYGSRENVLADALAFRADLDRAIKVLEAAQPMVEVPCPLPQGHPARWACDGQHLGQEGERRG
jgi:hypothetical protein